MTRLEELKAQKRLIEREIKMLTDTAVVYNRAKFETKTYPTGLTSWVLRIKADAQWDDGKSRWMPILYGDTKANVIARIPELIKDLEYLRAKLIKEDDNAETVRN